MVPPILRSVCNTSRKSYCPSWSEPLVYCSGDYNCPKLPLILWISTAEEWTTWLYPHMGHMGLVVKVDSINTNTGSWCHDWRSYWTTQHCIALLLTGCMWKIQHLHRSTIWCVQNKHFVIRFLLLVLPTVLWYCWLGIRKSIWPVKKFSDEVLAFSDAIATRSSQMTLGRTCLWLLERLRWYECFHGLLFALARWHVCEGLTVET